MIPSAIELATSLYGAWRLAKLDRAGIGLFNATIEGFWRSFFAAVLVAPGYVLVLVLSLKGETLSAGIGRIVTVESLAYVITWASFPLVMFYLAQNLDRSGDYLRYIVAFNWAQVLEIALYLPILVLVKQGIVTGALAALLQFAAYLAILGYEWFIAIVGLRLTRLPAAGIVLVALALNLLISIFAHGMIS